MIGPQLHELRRGGFAEEAAHGGGDVAGVAVEGLGHRREVRGVGGAGAQRAERQPDVLAEQPGHLRAQLPGRGVQLGRLLRRQDVDGQGVPEGVGVLVPLAVERVRLRIVACGVRVGLLHQVVVVRAQLRAHRLPGQPALRRLGHELGAVGAEAVERRPGLVAHGGVVRRQAARVVEQRRDVLAPQRLELGRPLLAAQGGDHLRQLVGVLADRRVRRLGEVLVVAQPAPHHVGGQDVVLAEQRLQTQRGVRRGARGRSRLRARLRGRRRPGLRTGRARRARGGRPGAAGRRGGRRRGGRRTRRQPREDDQTREQSQDRSAPPADPPRRAHHLHPFTPSDDQPTPLPRLGGLVAGTLRQAEDARNSE